MRILIVENDKGLRESLAALFKAGSFAVDTAGEGEIGLKLVCENDYDAVILSERLPKKDGLHVCREIRRSGKNTPLLFLLEGRATGNIDELLDAGVDDYLRKPISYDELKFRVQSLLRRPRNLMSPLLKIDDLVLDPSGQRVRRGKREIHLTRKEFALLEYLLRYRGMVISRPMLMEHVWNNDIDRLSNTIEAHILNLRNKIDKGAKKKLVQTVSGRGYKLEDPGKTIFT